MHILWTAALLLLFTPPSATAGTVCTPGPFVIFFDPNSSTLKREQVDTLDNVIEIVDNCGHVPHLSGHADSAENPTIVRDRLRAVTSYLAARGMFVKRRNIVNAGTSQPRVQTGANVSERQNRRIEIIYLPI